MYEWPDEKDPRANAMKDTKPVEEMEQVKEAPSLDDLIKEIDRTKRPK